MSPDAIHGFDMTLSPFVGALHRVALMDRGVETV
jgi:hypothetical protein